MLEAVSCLFFFWLASDCCGLTKEGKLPTKKGHSDAGPGREDAVAESTGAQDIVLGWARRRGEAELPGQSRECAQAASVLQVGPDQRLQFQIDWLSH